MRIVVGGGQMVTMDQRGIGEGEGSTLLYCTVLGEEEAPLYILLSDAVSHCGHVHRSTLQCSPVRSK